MAGLPAPGSREPARANPGGGGGGTRRGNGEVDSQWLGVLKLCNDPSAGSPTETLLRLLLPLNDRVWIAFRPGVVVADLSGPVRQPHLAIQSVVATGGVYKGQGRNQRKLMTCAY